MPSSQTRTRTRARSPNPAFHFAVFAPWKRSQTRYLLYNSSGTLYYGVTPLAIPTLTQLSPHEIRLLPRTPVPVQNYYPPYDPSTMTSLPYYLNMNPEASTCVYVKQQRFLTDPAFQARSTSTRYRVLIEREVKFCEVVLKDIQAEAQGLGRVQVAAHNRQRLPTRLPGLGPSGLRDEEDNQSKELHLARYIGVRVDPWDRVTGIAYQRYECDLVAFVEERRALSPRECKRIFEGVRKGVEALHRRGYVHCDVRPENVFLSFDRDDNGGCSSEEEEEEEEEGDESDEEKMWRATENKDRDITAGISHVVLGDFDAVVRIGERVLLKHAAGEWWPAEEFSFGSRARTRIDEFALERLEEWLWGMVRVIE